MERMKRRCKRGHLLVGKNAEVRPDGTRCRRCRQESRLVANEGDQGVACLICGARRRRLDQHLRHEHGIDPKTYEGELTAPVLREIRRDLLVDALADGVALIRRGEPAYPNGLCAKGLHPMRGKNLIRKRNGTRQCRACRNAAARAHYARRQPQPLK